MWKNDVVYDLGTLGGEASYAIAINDDGRVVGDAQADLAESFFAEYRAFVGNESGISELNLPRSSRWSAAVDINRAGSIVGMASIPPLLCWSEAGVEEIPPPEGFGYGTPIAINDAGHLLAVWHSWARELPIIYREGRIEEVVFGLNSEGWTLPSDMNNLGQICGFHWSHERGFRGFAWSEGEGLSYAENDADWLYFYPHALNDQGSVVGSATTRSYHRSAVLWSDGKIQDLNALLPPGSNWHLEVASDINENGQIVGQGTFRGEPKAFLLSPDRPVMRVDGNRDGAIDLEGLDDITTEDLPFRFWLNDDRDRYQNAEEDDFDPDEGPPDSSDRYINSKRDLEDFARLHVHIPHISESGSWRATLQFTDILSGNPIINVWRAREPNRDYLRNAEVADLQIRLKDPLIVSDSNEQEIPLKLFENDSEVATMLFEGRSEGRGILKLRVYKDNIVLAEDSVHLGLRPMASFYDHWTAGDSENVNLHQIPLVPDVVQFADIPPEDEAYVLFVHGWRLQPWERRAFAETAYKRLWHQGYRGRFGMFSWPTEWHASRKRDHLSDPQHYNRSEHKAYWSAFALHRLLVALNDAYPGQVRVLAHSMGNAVVSEAIKIETSLASPRRLVHTYVASQAATVARAYDNGPLVEVVRTSRVPDVYAFHPSTGAPYFESITRSAPVVVSFFNREDYALSYRLSWPLNQSTKPDMGYSFHPKRGISRIGPLRQVLTFPDDRAEIFAHVAPAWSRALGADSDVRGAVTGVLDLQDPPYVFTRHANDHSGQFRSYLARRWEYWEKVLDVFDLLR